MDSNAAGLNRDPRDQMLAIASPTIEVEALDARGVPSQASARRVLIGSAGTQALIVPQKGIEP